MTELSRDIVLDLLPLYMAGEVSPVTQRAVDEYLKTDQGLADYVSRSRDEAAASGESSGNPSQDLEVRSLRRTRKVLALQRWLFALAIAFTSVGLSTAVRLDSGIPRARLVALDHPLLMVPCLVAAVICWIMYTRMR